MVVAAGRVVGRARPGTALPVRPVKGQILELRTRERGGEPLDRIVRTPRCYLVGRGDGRVVLGRHDGGAGLRHHRHRRRRAPPARARLGGACPRPTSSSCARAVAGLRPGTPDNRPVIGEGDARAGSSGPPATGATASCWRPLTGEAVAELLAGGRLPEVAAGLGAGRFATAEVARMTSVRINGEPRRLPDGATVAEAVRESGVEPGGRGVAVALDGEVVPRGAVGQHAAGRGAGARGAPRRPGRRRHGVRRSPAASSARASCSAPAASATSR